MHLRDDKELNLSEEEEWRLKRVIEILVEADLKLFEKLMEEEALKGKNTK